MIEDQGQNQVETIKTFKSDNEKLTIENAISKSSLKKELDKKELKKSLMKLKK